MMSEPLGYDWGGDGSDLHRPVRAHVEAALVPPSGEPYPPPLGELLHLGDPSEDKAMPERIAALGLTQAQIPDLLRMARDRALNLAMSDSLEVWAPSHALTALGQLGLDEVIPDLIPLLDVYDEWTREQLVELLSEAGASAIEPLGRYVQDHTRWIYGRGAATETLGKLASKHPELRDQVVAILSDALERAADNVSDFNGFLLGDLLQLDAIEALPVIRRAFEQDLIDETIAGDWGYVLEKLGQTPDPNDALVERSRASQKARRARELGFALPEAAPTHSSAPPTKQKASPAAKAKNKRKATKASRKANKKRK
jgi:hypothetical protein